MTLAQYQHITICISFLWCKKKKKDKKGGSLTQHTFIIFHFLWGRSPGTVQLALLLQMSPGLQLSFWSAMSYPKFLCWLTEFSFLLNCRTQAPIFLTSVTFAAHRGPLQFLATDVLRGCSWERQSKGIKSRVRNEVICFYTLPVTLLLKEASIFFARTIRIKGWMCEPSLKFICPNLGKYDYPCGHKHLNRDCCCISLV